MLLNNIKNYGYRLGDNLFRLFKKLYNTSTYSYPFYNLINFDSVIWVDIFKFSFTALPVLILIFPNSQLALLSDF